MTTSLFENLLTEFAHRIGLTASQITAQIVEQNFVSLVFDQKIGVQVSYNETTDEICFASHLFHVAEENILGGIALMVAQANFEGEDLQHGAYLAMNEQAHVFLLCYVNIQLFDVSTFDTYVKKFIDSAEVWSETIVVMSEQLQTEQHKSETSQEPSAGIRV